MTSRWTIPPVATLAIPRKHGPRVDARYREIRETAWAHVQSVPYRVSLRWVFYRLLQGGLFQSKKGYSECVKVLSEARHQFINGWAPDTLADDRRDLRLEGGGFETDNQWVDDWVLHPESPWMEGHPNYWQHQPYYLIVAFEAAAMQGQFNYYLPPFVSRCAFGGQDSIEHKARLKDAIEAAANRYGKPIVVLYFGDYDEDGWKIPLIVERDVRSWTDTPFEWVRVALQEGQGEDLGISENPEKPGTYQWEALDDDLARTIIEDVIAGYIDDGGKEAAGEDGERRKEAWQSWWEDNKPTADDLGLTERKE